MSRYAKGDARDWARTEMKGVCNVIIPSYTADLRHLNEAAIRHDVRRDIELGFKGALLVSETAITPDEYIQMVEWAADEAAGRLVLFFHASCNTLEENVELAKRAEDAGAEMVLLSYPPSFYPTSLRQVYDYTEAFCAQTNLAVMVFPVPLWGFVPLQLIATSNTECLGGAVPRMLALCHEGRFDEAMQLYWQVDPARRANDRIGVAGGNTVHRMAWKYQAWLTGFNGGPLRMPTQRLVGPQLAGYRAAAKDAGVLTATESDEMFFVGRNPA